MRVAPPHHGTKYCLHGVLAHRAQRRDDESHQSEGDWRVWVRCCYEAHSLRGVIAANGAAPLQLLVAKRKTAQQKRSVRATRRAETTRRAAQLLLAAALTRRPQRVSASFCSWTAWRVHVPARDAQLFPNRFNSTVPHRPSHILTRCWRPRGPRALHNFVGVQDGGATSTIGNWPATAPRLFIQPHTRRISPSLALSNALAHASPSTDRTHTRPHAHTLSHTRSAPSLIHTAH